MVEMNTASDGRTGLSAEMACLMVEHSGDAIMLADVSTLCLIYANPAAERMLGRPLSEIVGVKMPDIHPEDARPRVLAQFEQQASGELSVAKDIPVMDSERQIRLYDVKAVPVTVDGRECLIGSFRDVTDRHEAEKELAEGQNRFTSAIAALPMGLLHYRLEEDDRLVLVGANPACDKILGIKMQDHMGQALDEIFPPLVETEVPAAYRRVAKEGGVWNLDDIVYEDEDISGAYEVVAFQIKPGETGVLFSDITERKKSEREMRRLMAAINGMNESVEITDPDGVILFVNPSFERLTGYSADEVRGQPIGAYKSGKHSKEFYEAMWKVLGAGGTWTGHLINKRRDGTLFEEFASISPVYDVDGELAYYVAVKRDMTRERDLERRVVRSQKMAALGQFAHRVAHDITNRLTVIMGGAQFLSTTTEDESGKALCARMLEAVEQLGTLTGDLMSFANIGKMSMETCALLPIVRGAATMIRETGEPDVTFTFDLRDKCHVSIDTAQIEQAIIHVAVNACESIKGQGNVRIALYEGSMISPDAITAGGSEQQEIPAAILEVTDDGSGMTDEECARAFEPFFTTKKDMRRHAGLGLATVYGIVMRHDGDVTIRSSRPGGTTVRISLPLV
jgi:two-component system cell cycle sensor histidine kinase/response regulator CckA